MLDLKFITGLRGFLCIWVVLFHYTYRYSILFGENFVFTFKNGGRVCVCMFFIISGFLTLLTIKKYYSDGGYVWLKNKLLRLYPSYAIACIIIFIFLRTFSLEGRDSVTYVDLIKDLLMLPFISGKIEGAHWYVFALVKFYITFYFIAKYQLQNKIWLYISILTLTSISAILNRYQEDIPITNILSIFLFSFLNIQIYTGLLLYKALEQPKKFTWLLILFITFLALKVNPISLPTIILFFYFASKSSKYLKGVKKILENKIAIYIGTISYIWYLTHQNIGYIIIKQLISTGVNKELAPYSALVLSFLLASTLYNLLDAPLTNWIYSSQKTSHVE